MKIVNVHVLLSRPSVTSWSSCLL